MQFGLTLSSEEHGPRELVDLARRAEAGGFDFVSISDHYHPWIAEQGHSPFVWSVLGGIAEATERIDVVVGVTCPTVRIHPAILAQATATTAVMLESRFVWGVGSGEALNEHILGDRWPPADIRLEMLEEAVTVIRRLWSEESVTHRGRHYTVEDARVFDRPTDPPPIVVSAFGPKSGKLAARIGDGLWTTGTGGAGLASFRNNGGTGPTYSQLTLCWAEDRQEAVQTAHRIWPNTAIPGQLNQDLRTIDHMEAASSSVTAEQIAAAVPCGPDPEPLLDSVQQAADAGIDHVYFHQIGDDQEGFLRFWETKLRAAVHEMTTDDVVYLT